MKLPIDSAGAQKPGFFWRGVLILLPLVLLAGVGIYSLRQDRRLVEIEARERCQSVAEDYARAIVFGMEVESLHSLEFSTFELSNSDRSLVAISGYRSRATMIEQAVPHPLPEIALTPEQREAWDAARRDEFLVTNDALPPLKKFISLAPPKVFLTRARYDLAFQYAARNDANSADSLFAEVEQDSGALSEAGLPLFLLAQYQRWKLAGPHSPSAETLCSNAVEHPSLISPLLLASAGGQKWLDLWRRDEAARQFFQHLRPVLTNGAHPSFWTHWKNEDWLVFPAEKDMETAEFATHATCVMAAVPLSIVATVVKKAAPPGQQWISYAEPAIEVAGLEVTAGHHSGSLLATASVEQWLGATVSEYMARPDVLYARARTRTAWFAALILVSAVAALIGFVSACRGFNQQLRLGEMKSNFVSSVSHELRAPIASMRLLAESLERGKIADETKRKEYFGLLVRESRRLSLLIDNILDFSRIEQGRKKYEFEPVDIAALVEQTVQLMRPGAAERQVALELDKNGGPCPESFACDGLALQQALVNLIDNAIKHSPAGGRVTVGVGGGGAGLRLWVQDNGPGIPPAEQERIFERFYRRGSELRRETQGIGIGLTIVKHIVEAHGGRVTVRSAVGQGSRFTIEAPGS